MSILIPWQQDVLSPTYIGGLAPWDQKHLPTRLSQDTSQACLKLYRLPKKNKAEVCLKLRICQIFLNLHYHVDKMAIDCVDFILIYNQVSETVSIQ